MKTYHRHVPAILLGVAVLLAGAAPCLGQGSGYSQSKPATVTVEIRNLTSWTEVYDKLIIHWTSWQEVRSTGLRRTRLAAVITHGDRSRLAQRLQPIDPLGRYHSHHGMQSAWMQSRFSRYDKRHAPSILVLGGLHTRAHRLGNSLLPREGRQFLWNQVTERQMRTISQRMFDSLGLPGRVRIQYWREFSRYRNTLSRDGRSVGQVIAWATGGGAGAVRLVTV